MISEGLCDTENWNQKKLFVNVIIFHNIIEFTVYFYKIIAALLSIKDNYIIMNSDNAHFFYYIEIFNRNVNILRRKN